MYISPLIAFINHLSAYICSFIIFLFIYLFIYCLCSLTVLLVIVYYVIGPIGLIGFIPLASCKCATKIEKEKWKGEEKDWKKK